MSSIKMKKFVSLKGVIDNIRQSVNTPSPPGMMSPSNPSNPTGSFKLEHEILENLTPDQFSAAPTVRHGFPFKATSLAFDPLQRLLAIGNKTGEVRIFGRPGIDLSFEHENTGASVFQMIFVANTGRMLTACTDDSVNLWDFNSKPPELVQSLKLNKEHLIVMNLEFGEKWLLLGTDRGNVLILNMDTFSLSGRILCLYVLQN